MESLYNALSDALKLSESLCQNQSTFFLGAGFSKSMNLPSFWELVRNRILPGFVNDLVKNGTKKDWAELLDINEFKPKNCLECFMNSYIGGLSSDYKKDWSQQIHKASLTDFNGNIKTFQTTLKEFIESLKAKNKVESQAYRFLEKMETKSGEEYVIYLEKLRLMVDDKAYKWSNCNDCAKCMKSLWNGSGRDQSGYILGLLQAYLDQGAFQIVNLLEFIQYSMDKKKNDGKIKIAKYAFDKNPDFKKFDKIIEEYHKCPEKSITDSQIALARLSKEGLIHQVITTNWDDLMELACYALDMYVKTNDGRVFGLAGEELSDEAQNNLENKRYVYSAVSISEKEDFFYSNYILAPTKKTFHLYKIHGGIDKILHNIPSDDQDQENLDHDVDWNFVITHRDLADWRDDQWSKELVSSILRSHDIIFAGISGGDNVIYATIRRIFEELSSISTPSVAEAEQQKTSKNVFAINVQKELVLSNMITGRTGIKEDSIILDHKIKLNQVSGSNLFYRFVYVFYILQYLLGDVRTYARKMVEYVHQGENIYSKVKETEELIIDFVKGKLFAIEQVKESKDKKQKEYHLDYMDVFYDVIPKLIIYTWLLNNHLSSIRAETDSKNFLLKKPHFYLPVLTYSKWFTMYLLIFAKLYDYIVNPKNKIMTVKITKDGVIVLNGVAILFMVTAEPHWENLRQIGTQAFSKQSLEVMNRAWKKAIIIWDLHGKEEESKKAKDIMNHMFTPYYLNYERIFRGFDQFMEQIFSIEEEE